MFKNRNFYIISFEFSLPLYWCSINGFIFMSEGKAVKLMKIQLKVQNVRLPSLFPLLSSRAELESLLGQFWLLGLMFDTCGLDESNI